MPLKDCLTHQVILRLVKEQHWQCIFLMRLVLLFLKQAKTVAQLDEVVSIGVNIVDQILIAKPWSSKGSSKGKAANESNKDSFWPNLKRGLCFFAAEYNGKSPSVAEVFRKHLAPFSSSSDGPSSDKDNQSKDKNSAILKEFCDESPVMMEIFVTS